MKIVLDGQEVEMTFNQVMVEASRRGVKVHTLTCQQPRTCVVCSPQFCLRDIIEEMQASPDAPGVQWAERLTEIADQVRKMELRAAGTLG